MPFNQPSVFGSPFFNVFPPPVTAEGAVEFLFAGREVDEQLANDLLQNRLWPDEGATLVDFGRLQGGLPGYLWVLAARNEESALDPDHNFVGPIRIFLLRDRIGGLEVSVVSNPFVRDVPNSLTPIADVNPAPPFYPTFSVSPPPMELEPIELVVEARIQQRLVARPLSESIVVGGEDPEDIDTTQGSEGAGAPGESDPGPGSPSTPLLLFDLTFSAEIWWHAPEFSPQLRVTHGVVLGQTTRNFHSEAQFAEVSYYLDFEQATLPPFPLRFTPAASPSLTSAPCENMESIVGIAFLQIGGSFAPALYVDAAQSIDTGGIYLHNQHFYGPGISVLDPAMSKAWGRFNKSFIGDLCAP